MIAGDFLYHPTEDDSHQEALEEFDEDEHGEVRELIQKTLETLAPLVQAGIPVFAVLENHDYAMEKENALKISWVADELSEALQAAGIRVLRNQAASVGLPAHKDSSPGSDQTEPPLYVVGIGPRYPHEDLVEKSFNGVPDKAARIVLMHNPETFKEIPSGKAPLALAGHTDGWIQGFGNPGNRLYINRGIGFSKIPVMINCRPEITWITLQKAAS